MCVVYKGGYLVKPKRTIIFFTETVTIPERVFSQALRRSVSGPVYALHDDQQPLPRACALTRAQQKAPSQEGAWVTALLEA
jgi:hypothetical protein